MIDKVYRPSTLQLAWEQVKANKGAAGIDKQSIEGFAANEQVYLNELAENLEQGTYRRIAFKIQDKLVSCVKYPTETQNFIPIFLFEIDLKNFIFYTP